MMRSVIQELARDEHGAIGAGDYLLLAVVVGIGGLVGLAVVRDQVSQEFGDLAVALRTLDQSFDVEIEVDGDVVYAASFDNATFANPVLGPLEDNPGEAPACMEIAPDP